MGACFSNNYLKTDEDYLNSFPCQSDIKYNVLQGEQIIIRQELLTQEDELIQNLEREQKEYCNSIKEQIQMEDRDTILTEDLGHYEENIKYVETEKYKLEHLKLETQNFVDFYKKENGYALQNTYRKDISFNELRESQSSKISEITQELRNYQISDKHNKYFHVNIDHIKRVILEHVEKIVQEQRNPLNSILLSIKNNEGKILSLETKFFKTMNYICKLKETKLLLESQASQREHSMHQLSIDKHQLQTDKEKYEQETLPEMRKNIQNLETELDFTRNSLKTAEKEIALVTSKLNQIDTGPYSIFMQDITKQLIARERELETIKSECKKLRNEYKEISLKKEEIEDFLSIVPLQKFKFKQLQEQLSVNIRDLEDTLSYKNAENTRITLHNKKLRLNVDSMAKCIEYQSIVILDLQKHLRDIEGFYLKLQKKLNELLHSFQTDIGQSLNITSKATLHSFSEKLNQLGENISKDLRYISNATQTSLNRMKYPKLFFNPTTIVSLLSPPASTQTICFVSLIPPKDLKSSFCHLLRLSVRFLL